MVVEAMTYSDHITCSGCGHCSHPECDLCTCNAKDYEDEE